jgi:sugar phosphate isomerase/epimerase
MIYVSTTCSGKANIKEAVVDLVEAGFTWIELSGGTKYYPSYLEDLRELQQKYNLKYRLHNYFPPPEKPFVLNLASSDDLILERSRKMVKDAIDISVLLKSFQYGLHAGFRISPRVEELGQKILGKTVLPYVETLERFSIEYNQLTHYADSLGVTLLLENNVFSSTNKKSFNGENPFFLTDSADYFEMKRKFSFPLLLDIAHLKVSCHSLSIDFIQELKLLLTETNYVHISDNDGLSDSNKEFSAQSSFFQVLKEQDLRGKTFTIEVYEGLAAVRRCYDLLEALT